MSQLQKFNRCLFQLSRGPHIARRPDHEIQNILPFRLRPLVQPLYGRFAGVRFAARNTERLMISSTSQGSSKGHGEGGRELVGTGSGRFGDHGEDVKSFQRRDCFVSFSGPTISIQDPVSISICSPHLLDSAFIQVCKSDSSKGSGM